MKNVHLENCKAVELPPIDPPPKTTRLFHLIWLFKYWKTHQPSFFPWASIVRAIPFEKLVVGCLALTFRTTQLCSFLGVPSSNISKNLRPLCGNFGGVSRTTPYHPTTLPPYCSDIRRFCRPPRSDIRKFLRPPRGLIFGTPDTANFSNGITLRVAYWHPRDGG